MSKTSLSKGRITNANRRTALPALAILVSMIAVFSFGGQDRWTSNGPEGGYILALAVNPSERATLYAAAYGGGIYRTTDAGETWRAINNGVTDYFVRCLAIDPANPSTIYAGSDNGGLFKSVDGGESWISSFRTSSVRTVIVDPTNHLTVYLGTSAGVFISTDGGGTWMNVNNSLDVRDLAMDPTNPSRLYVASSSGLFTTDNRGGDWTELNLRAAFNTAANVIGVDPSNSQRLYVASDDVIFHTTDAGKTWKGTRLATSIRHFLIDSSGTAYAATDTGLFRSDDGGETWRLLPALQNTGIETLALDPANRATLYAGAAGLGVFRSTDGAKNWSAKNSGLTAGYARGVALDPSNPSLMYAATAAGVFMSVNGGNRWISSNGAMTDAVTVAIDPTTPSTVYAGGYQTASRTIDGGETWTQIQPNPAAFGPHNGVRKFVIDPSNPSTLYAALVDNGISKSTTGGDSWIPANNGLTFGYYGFYAYSLAVDPTTPSTLFAGSGGIVKSTDSAARWESVNGGLPVDSGYVVTPSALAIDPSRPSIVYAATSRGLFRTVDGAQHWAIVGNGLPAQSVTDVAIDPADPSTVYAATYQSGIVRSTDRGLSWAPFNNGLASGGVNSIAVDSTGRFLVAGTSAGVFTYEVVSKLPVELRREPLPDDPSRLSRLLDQLQHQGGAGSGFLIVATGNVTGVGGARFRSDVSLINHKETSQSVIAAWLAAGSVSANAPSSRLTLSGSSSTTVAGLVDQLGFSGLGALVVIAIDANGDVDSRASIEGSSRLWMTGPNNPGTVSDSVAGVPLESLGKRTTSSATGLRSDSDFRTNVGVVNLDTQPRTFSINLTGERYSSTVSVNVGPLSMRQIAVPRGDYGAMSAIFTTSSGDFLWTAYGSSVKNLTGEGSVASGK